MSRTELGVWEMPVSPSLHRWWSELWQFYHSCLKPSSSVRLLHVQTCTAFNTFRNTDTLPQHPWSGVGVRLIMWCYWRMTQLFAEVSFVFVSLSAFISFIAQRANSYEDTHQEMMRAILNLHTHEQMHSDDQSSHTIYLYMYVRVYVHLQ